MKKFFGWTLLALPFVLVMAFAMATLGPIITFVGIGLTLLLTGTIYLGIILIED